MKLLLAEDEKELSNALVAVLKANNYIVDAVYDGADAYDWAVTDDYDGIILDIMMPKRNGIDVLAQLRKDGIKTPVLLLTAKSEVEDRVLGLDTNIDPVGVHTGDSVVVCPSQTLTNKEYQMLEMLMRNKGRLVSSEQFIEHVWGYETDINVNVVWVNISNLRRKLTQINAPVEIKAVRGLGYRLEGTGEQNGGQ